MSGKTLSCRKARRVLDRYLDNELSPGRIPPLEDHLTGCPDCRGYLESSRFIGEAFRASAPGIDEVMNDRAWSGIVEGMGRRDRPTLGAGVTDFWRWVSFYPRPVWLSTFAAAALAVALLIPFGMNHDKTIYSHPVVEFVESSSAHVIVLMPDENPVTVIWIFEEREI